MGRPVSSWIWVHGILASWRRRVTKAASASVSFPSERRVSPSSFGARGEKGVRQRLLHLFEHGYFPTYAGQRCELGAVLADLGAGYEVLRTAVKPYPACRASHSAIDAVACEAAEHDLAASDIERIDLTLGQLSVASVAEPAAAKRRPASIVEAQFSVYFSAAVALLERGFTWQSYGRLGDRAVQAIMDRVHVHEGALPHLACRLAATTRGGKRYEREKLLPKGEPECFLSREELVAKARPLLGCLLPLEQAEALLRGVRLAEQMTDVGQLTRLIRP